MTIARIIAAVTSLVTFAYLFVNGSWRADNPFLVPDLILCAALLVAAAMRDRLVLIAAFCYTAGVFVTSVASYAVDGRLGVPSLIGVLVSAGAVVALQRRAAPRDSQAS